MYLYKLILLTGFLCTVAAAAPPNIIIVLADDLGYGDPQCYNAESPLATPSMDRLARGGMRFTDAHSASGVCTPSRYTLLTGQYSWRTELKEGVLWGYSPSLLKAGQRTIASLCKDAGYATACVGKWHLGLGTAEKADYAQPQRPNPTDFGFDYFFGIPASLDMDPYVYIENERAIAPPTETVDAHDMRGPQMYRGGPMAPGFDHRQVLPTLQEKALEWVRAQEGPFFLYFPLTSPHTPCLPTEEFQGKSGLGDYGDFVLQTDAVLGSLLAALDEKGISENTLIVFTSDNGAHEPILPEGATHDPNRPLRGQKADAWEGGHRVPFLVRWPASVAAGGVCDKPVGQVDLFATVSEILGHPTTAEEAGDSLSLLPLFKGAEWSDSSRVGLVHHSSQGKFAVRRGPWKYIEGVGGGGFGWSRNKDIPQEGEPPGQLYNLADDPGETTNVFAAQPEIAAEMQALLEQCKTRETVRR